jgi:hypothetical protein
MVLLVLQVSALVLWVLQVLQADRTWRTRSTHLMPQRDPKGPEHRSDHPPLRYRCVRDAPAD